MYSIQVLLVITSRICVTRIYFWADHQNWTQKLFSCGKVKVHQFFLKNVHWYANATTLHTFMHELKNAFLAIAQANVWRRTGIACGVAFNSDVLRSKKWALVCALVCDIASLIIQPDILSIYPARHLSTSASAQRQDWFRTCSVVTRSESLSNASHKSPKTRSDYNNNRFFRLLC